MKRWGILIKIVERRVTKWTSLNLLNVLAEKAGEHAAEAAKDIKSAMNIGVQAPLSQKLLDVAVRK
jgi:hypothetical protein